MDAVLKARSPDTSNTSVYQPSFPKTNAQHAPLDPVLRSTGANDEHGSTRSPPNEPVGRGDDASFKHLEKAFPWLFNPSWCNAGVREDLEGLKSAVRDAKSIVHSLDSFYRATKSRSSLLQTRLYEASTKKYFPLLTDNILALIFEYATLPNAKEASEGECDFKIAGRISLVSRQFRKVALRVPRLWRSIHSSQSASDEELFLSRTAGAGPILEVHLDSQGKGRWQRMRDRILLRVCDDLTFASRITCLRFDFCRTRCYYEVQEFANEKCFENMSFPSLYELSITYDYGRTAEDIQFCRGWKMTSLKLLRARNVIPDIQKTILSGVIDCFLHFEADEDDSEHCWKYNEIFAFIQLLNGTKSLDMTLHGNAFKNESRNYSCKKHVASQTTEHLRTALPGTEDSLIDVVLKSFSAPNKKTWTLEIDSDDTPLEHVFAQLELSPGRKVGKLNESGPHSLQEFNIVFLENSESGGLDCEQLRQISGRVDSLEKFSVTYATSQKFEFENCKGRFQEVMDHLEKEASAAAPASCFVLDKSELLKFTKAELWICSTLAVSKKDCEIK
ncbi:hypothetical protein SCHPADRAFT_945343 [Schizopora paradoxa]|uniref:F-box domain-containing protein n=1 Tax=Schizopora paradoxa TaxID=27342 RepID=A0A0H2R6D2_9AGAM|nr:hypothetical protein SCHPADRAFT_945343 [Schizopora paradoxa]